MMVGAGWGISQDDHKTQPSGQAISEEWINSNMKNHGISWLKAIPKFNPARESRSTRPETMGFGCYRTWRFTPVSALVHPSPSYKWTNPTLIRGVYWG
jgi:hypothetical protein